MGRVHTPGKGMRLARVSKKNSLEQAVAGPVNMLTLIQLRIAEIEESLRIDQSDLNISVLADKKVVDAAESSVLGEAH